MNSNCCNFGVIKNNIQCLTRPFQYPFYGLEELMLSFDNKPVAAAEHL